MKLYDNTTENGQNYRNPVLYMDYSDPDVIRVGEDYYCLLYTSPSPRDS